MRHRFQAEQWLPYPLEDVFRFFSDPANLPRLMPSWHKARIEAMKLVPPPNTATEVVAAGAGSRITISFRPFLFSPVRLRWEAEIADFAWNQHFSDLQRKGPFAYWLHRHSVQPSASNGPSGIRHPRHPRSRRNHLSAPARLAWQHRQSTLRQRSVAPHLCLSPGTHNRVAIATQARQIN